jgi:chromate transporter
MSASTMTDSSNLDSPGRGSLTDLAQEFLRLGFVAFGGPAAHIAMMEERFVRRLSWLPRERFLDMLGAVNLLPGPSSTELATYLGEMRGGLPGLFVAGACFILPAALLVIALAWAYQTYGSVPQVAGLLVGIKPVVVALIAQAVCNLARTALKNVRLAILAVAVLSLASFGVPVLALLIGSGVLWILFREGKRLASLHRQPAVAVATFASLAANSVGPAPLFLYFLKIGSVLFGSGYVLLAVLRADLVLRRHWLTDAQLLDAIAVSQATPGPFFTVSTFIGYLLNGWKGAALATVGMFLPAFLYVAVTAQVLPNLRKSPFAAAFLDGVNAAAVALMASVGYQFARATLINLPVIALAVVSVFLVSRYKLNSTWLVLGGAVLGILLRTLGKI